MSWRKMFARRNIRTTEQSVVQSESKSLELSHGSWSRGLLLRSHVPGCLEPFVGLLQRLCLVVCCEDLGAVSPGGGRQRQRGNGDERSPKAAAERAWSQSCFAFYVFLLPLQLQRSFAEPKQRSQRAQCLVLLVGRFLVLADLSQPFGGLHGLGGVQELDEMWVASP